MSNWIEIAIEKNYITLFQHDSFQDWKVIGRGAFGTVYSAYSKDAEKTVALKCLHHDFTSDNGNEFIQEVKKIIRFTHHDHIIRFFGITQDPKGETYYMVLQYANNSDLRCYLSNHFLELNWETKIRMAKEIASGVNCLHNANIVHRDLHDKNILVHDDRLLITDFGLSKSLENNTKSIVGGTCAYSDPKYLQNPFLYKRGKPSDIYSLGVLFWELSSGVRPFKNITDQTGISFLVISGQRESPINGTPMDFLNLYNIAWNGNPDLRPNIAEIRDKLNNIAMDQIYYGEDVINEHYMVQSKHDQFLSEQVIITNDQYTIPSNLNIVSSEQDIIPNDQDTIPSNLDIVSSEQDMSLHERDVIQSDQDIVLSEQEYDTIKLDFRCVVALDIGARFSGFAYASTINPEIITNDTARASRRI
ncbi:kinase-like domain-containing protein [Gigaspora rosea]|uniref:Kinase-like domain-containing protein n=1 Tax=Gigaspora rosea TaxID=44941 RepID=A0A397UKF0_9GLOM|nr:kinase-like domain-containing protein [Gigaspora rosea]